MGACRFWHRVGLRLDDEAGPANTRVPPPQGNHSAGGGPSKAVMTLSRENEAGPGRQGGTRPLLRVGGVVGWETPSGFVSSQKTPRAEGNPARLGTASEPASQAPVSLMASCYGLLC